MNYQEKFAEYRKAKALLFNHYPEGCIKITEKESLLHATIKLQVAYWFKVNGYEVYDEIVKKRDLEYKENGFTHDWHLMNCNLDLLQELKSSLNSAEVLE